MGGIEREREKGEKDRERGRGKGGKKRKRNRNSNSNIEQEHGEKNKIINQGTISPWQYDTQYTQTWTPPTFPSFLNTLP